MFIGCAGWSLGREYWPQFPAEGTHLQRYAAQFNCVEINSSFYRPHRRQTYARWADSVPPGFRFSVKMPKQITHELRLQNCDQALDEFLGQCEGLADRLECLLVQLPPSLVFEPASAEAFFVALRQRFAGAVVLEPRHESWVAAPMLQAYRIAQVVVDPSRIYHSAYDERYLQALAEQMKVAAAEGAAAWCIFDNTASGAALGNALALAALMAD